MRRITNLLLILTVTCSFCSNAAAAEKDDKPITLFGGESLDGWDYFLVEPEVKMADVWSVKDKILVCKGEPMGYISTKKEFTNFKLTVVWRWPPGKKPGNSGVLLRITGEPKALPHCVESQLQSGNAGDFWAFHGFMIQGDAGRTRKVESPQHGKITGISKSKAAEKKPGEWNTMEITADGGAITVVVNGQEVNKTTDADVVAGKIGLQSEGGEIHFRSVQLVPLK